jgi:transposase
MLPGYSKELEKQMQELYRRLSEKNKRQYAAIEALKLSHGGISYIAKLFGCSRDTIRVGIKELGQEDELPGNRNRKAGGGRKSALASHEAIDELFLAILQDHTAGDPMNEQVKWTNLSVEAIKQRLKKAGITVSRNIVRKLLKKHDYVKRKALKKKAAGGHVNRNAQFERIKALRQDYEATGNPIISVDTKKKELLGNLYREGRLYTRETLEVSDHDFPSLADGVVIPHGIYDVVRNEAMVNIGTSRDTGEFACDSIGHWWATQGQFAYPNATSLLMLMDGGGSNSSRHYLFKQDLQALADKLGIPIRVAHYPPYTSKWNPIEHRLFPHVTRALQGVIFKSHELVKELIETTTTKNGLTVKATIFDKVYRVGRKIVAGFKKSMRILFDDHLGCWNYVAVPQQG